LCVLEVTGSSLGKITLQDKDDSLINIRDNKGKKFTLTYSSCALMRHGYEYQITGILKALVWFGHCDPDTSDPLLEMSLVT
jgi:hypothetical protein